MSPRSSSIFDINSLGNDMPTAIEYCIITVLTKLISIFIYSSVSKSFNMSGKRGAEKYYNLHKPASVRSGIKYDKDIDIAIINELARSKESTSGDLKRRVEKTLGRTINPKTYYDHVQKLKDENVVHKRDTGARGIASVFYSLTEEAEKRRQLKLLRTDPENELFKKIYANLLFKGITEPEIYCYDLDKLLSDLHVTRKDLVIDHIEKKYFSEKSHIRIGGKPEERILPNTTVIYYKQISNVQITETITYHKNIRTHHVWEENSILVFSVPGISIKEFSDRFYTFRPKPEDVEKAFLLLWKNHLIKPLMEFRGETRYVLADDALHDLITDIRLLHKVEKEESYLKLTYYGPPSEEEIEKRKVFYTEEKLFNEFYNRKEIQRLEFRTTMKEKKGKKAFKQLRKELEHNMKLVEDEKNIIIDQMKQKHKKILKQYAFLSDIIRLVCPVLFMENHHPNPYG